MSGAQLTLALGAVALATAVLPPAAAWWLNATRITETQARAVEAAERVGALAPEPFAEGHGIVCGPGRLPDARPSSATGRLSSAARAVHDAWVLGAVKAPELFGSGMPTDAWGRCFLMNTGAASGAQRVWILSAGPNGIIDTPADAATLAADDIGAVVK